MKAIRRSCAVALGVALTILAQEPPAAAPAEVAKDLFVVIPPSAQQCFNLVESSGSRLEMAAAGLSADRQQRIRDGLGDLRAACKLIRPGDRLLMPTAARGRWELGQEKIRRAVAEPPPPPAPPPPPKAISRSPDRIVLPYTQTEVWIALMQAITQAHITPTLADQPGGTLTFETGPRWGEYWGDANRAISLMTVKEVKARSTWRYFSVTGEIFCRAQSEQATEVKARFRFVGFNDWAGWKTGPDAGWQELSSSGYLEGWIFDRIEEWLPDRQGPTAPLDGPRPDPAVVSGAHSALIQLDFVLAGFEVKMGKKDRSRRLAEAQATIDAFVSSPEGKQLPRFSRAIVEPLDRLRAAVVSVDPRADVAAAAALAAEARGYLNSYRRGGREGPAGGVQ